MWTVDFEIRQTFTGDFGRSKEGHRTNPNTRWFTVMDSSSGTMMSPLVLYGTKGFITVRNGSVLDQLSKYRLLKKGLFV